MTRQNSKFRIPTRVSSEWPQLYCNFKKFKQKSAKIEVSLGVFNYGNRNGIIGRRTVLRTTYYYSSTLRSIALFSFRLGLEL